MIKAAHAAALPLALDARRVGELLERMLDTTSDVALVMDGEGRVLDVRVRDAAFRLIAQRHWLGRRWHDIVTLESHDKVDALLQGALAGRPEPPRQVNHPARSGPDWPVLYTAVATRAVHDDNDSPSPAAKKKTAALAARAEPAETTRYVVACGRDLRDTMTMQRQLVDAQQAMERDYWRLREAEGRYRSLFQASGEGVLIVDAAKLRVTEANPAALAMLEGKRGTTGKVVGSPLGAWIVEPGEEPLNAAASRARTLGQAQRLDATLANGARASMWIDALRQDETPLLMVRIAAAVESAGTGPKAKAARGSATSMHGGSDAFAHAGAAGRGASFGMADGALIAAFVQQANDALAFTDTDGRIVLANRAFARLVQLPDDTQAVSRTLDRWVGRSGVELQVLLTNLRGAKSPGLFSTLLRGEQGLETPVEIAATPLNAGGSGQAAHYAFAIRDTGRRLNGDASSRTMPAPPTSAAQLGELVGRVPLKQIVAETSDLIEKLSIETALKMSRDNRALAAQMLGLSRQSLYVKLHRYGLGGMGEGAEADER
jgi:PAS domain-containing protein